ncbi:hypothetical protein M8R20_31475 [Pseudomonas sp. R2.Fl]|nr:hypothetical protein [Pseudomonas sp. R2.Fl]
MTGIRMFHRFGAVPAACCLLSAALSASAAVPAVRSEVKGLHIAARDALPVPREPQVLEEGHFCRMQVIEPRTAAGRAVAARGWYVTSEIQAAGHTSVGAFSRGGEATSGTCFIADGNVFVFRGPALAAIVYGDPPEDAYSGGLVGGVAGTTLPDRVRITDRTPPDFAQADLRFGADAIDVVPVAERETFCGGLVIPNLRGKDIPEARKILAREGWRPAPHEAPEDAGYDAATGYRAEGMPEFETCSGTGYGFCVVNYDRADGAQLHVTTVGDEPPTVSAYDVRCTAR